MGCEAETGKGWRRSSKMTDALAAKQINESDWRRGISLAAEFGGRTIPDRIVFDITRLRSLLFQFCYRAYSDEVLGFALAVRVDGELKQYRFEGTDSVKRNRKEQYIAADIGIPFQRWRGLSEAQFRLDLFLFVQQALQDSVERLKKDGVELKEKQLWTDFAKVRARFLKERFPVKQ